MKEAYYFSHDTNARHDPKILALRAKYDYGNYWIIIEMLRESEGYKLPCKKYIWSAIAQQISTNAKTCTANESEQFVNDCIEEFELFKSDGEFFWSDSLLKRMDKKEKISSERSNAAHAKHAKYKQEKELAQQNSANVMQNSANAQQNSAIKGKESKGKEKKESKGKEEKEVVAAAAAIPEEVSVYPLFLSVYDEFIIKKTGGPAKIDGIEGKAAKSIIAYLRRRPRVVDDDSLISAWAWVFKNWEKLEPYQAKRIKLSEIASDITKIFDQINNYKNGFVKKPLSTTVGVSQGKEFGSL